MRAWIVIDVLKTKYFWFRWDIPFFQINNMNFLLLHFLYMFFNHNFDYLFVFVFYSVPTPMKRYVITGYMICSGMWSSTQLVWTLTFTVSLVCHACFSSLWGIRYGASILCSRRISPRGCSRIAPWIVWWRYPWYSFSLFQNSGYSLAWKSWERY